KGMAFARVAAVLSSGGLPNELLKNMGLFTIFGMCVEVCNSLGAAGPRSWLSDFAWPWQRTGIATCASGSSSPPEFFFGGDQAFLVPSGQLRPVLCVQFSRT